MLLSLIRISIRNVTRNSRRSMITATAVLIGTLFIIIARGLLNGFQAQIVAGFTETQAGDVQIHRPEYLESNEALPLDKSFSINQRFREMMGKVDRVQAYTGRIQFSGMINNGLTHPETESTTLFFGYAVDPENEYKVCPRNRDRVKQGGPVVPSDPDGIVLGKALAESLQIKVGDQVTLLVNTSGRGLNARDVHVAGISDILIPGVGNKTVHIPLATAQKLLYMENQVTEVLINVKDLEDVDKVNARLNELFSGEFKDLNLTPNTWKDVGALYLGAIETQNTVLVYIIVVLFIVMIAGIINTMLMSVFERVREIGTMMSIGVRRNKILFMFVLESASLGTLGGLVGVSIGALIVTVFERSGLSVPLPGGEWATMFPYIRLPYMSMVAGIALTVAMFAALYPAYRASKLRPAEALRTL